MSDLTLTVSGTKRLLTKGKYCDKNIVANEITKLPQGTTLWGKWCPGGVL